MKKKKGAGAIKFFGFLAGVFAIEIFICNFRHWESAGNSQISGYTVLMGSGYEDHGNGVYTYTGENGEIKITNINDRLESAWIHMETIGQGEDERKPIRIKQLATDESHKLYYSLPQRELWAQEEKSAYMNYHLYGKCTGLKIIPELEAGQMIAFQISLNPRIPLFFSWERVCFMILLGMGVWLLRPASKWNETPYLSLNRPKKAVLTGSFFLLHGILFWGLVHVNPYFQKEQGENQQQYQALAEALEAGSLSLLEAPPKTLAEMENPYDFDARGQILGERGEWYKWDHAYFQGKYYVYFGVVPVALFYLPYHFLTGEHLHNYIVIFLLSLLFLAGVLGTVHELIRKWFPRTTLNVWFLTTELLLMGSGILYMTKRPDLYTVPILAGLAFGMLGMWCFLLAREEEKIRYGYLGAGSFLIALIAGCRPQLFVFVFLVWILAGDYLMPLGKEKKALFACLAPMLAVGGLLMYYNASRFGSVVDFGANYNLTFNDMRRRGWEWERLPLGVLAYLFQPIKLTTGFPFAEAVYFDSQYMGVTIQEATYGGMFMTHLFAWMSLLPMLFHKQLKSCGKTPWRLSVASLLLGLVVIAADTNMSGILQRYFGDFSLFMMFAALLSALLLLSHKRFSSGVLRRTVVWCLMACLLLEVCYQGMVFFLDTGEALRELRPDLFSHFKYVAAFWL